MSTSTEIDRVIKGFYCIIGGLTHCGIVIPYGDIWPDSTKPFKPDPVLTSHW